MKVSYNITQNKFNASLNQETTEIKVSFKTGYYPFPSDLDLSNYYTKSETYSKVEIDEIISEIPVVDTSNLVPYTGATQDVNIGAYYFESSQGFKKTGGTANQALTANGGVFDLNTKADLVGGKMPSSQLPSYVDDVLEFANLASFPATGESGKIYIAIDTNITYRWTGTGYAEISASLALGETASTAYRGDRGKIAYDHSQTTGNPHSTTKADIGLGNVDNTSDLNKPISTATQNALNTKADIDDIPTKTSFTHDILVANWTLVSGKYEAIISNAGILANSFVDVIPSNDNVDIVRNAQIYPSVLISAGSVKVYSKFLPSGTISVTVNVN